ncbi:hypothetical protein O0L34_g9353 [Tuta absoluta]|nr:hypothetical protein O0L34_g9353 [Tuta absoluta]
MGSGTKRYCCIPDCGTDSITELMFRFPGNPMLGDEWIRIVSLKYPNLEMKKDINGRIAKYICRLHFEAKYVVDGRRAAIAIPTLFEPNEISQGRPNQPIEIVLGRDHPHGLGRKRTLSTGLPETQIDSLMDLSTSGNTSNPNLETSPSTPASGIHGPTTETVPRPSPSTPASGIHGPTTETVPRPSPSTPASGIHGPTTETVPRPSPSTPASGIHGPTTETVPRPSPSTPASGIHGPTTETVPRPSPSTPASGIHGPTTETVPRPSPSTPASGIHGPTTETVPRPSPSTPASGIHGPTTETVPRPSPSTPASGIHGPTTETVPRPSPPTPASGIHGPTTETVPRPSPSTPASGIHGPTTETVPRPSPPTPASGIHGPTTETASVPASDHKIIIGGHKLNIIYDPPHLLKGIRNNLLTKDMSFCGDMVRWNDIVEVYKADCQIGDVRLLNKLNDEHIQPTSSQKMKVKNCTQVLSERMAAMLKYTAQFGQRADGTSVSPTMGNTAKAVLFFDKLFDSVNGSRRGKKAGKLRGAVKDDKDGTSNYTAAEVQRMDDDDEMEAQMAALAAAVEAAEAAEARADGGDEPRVGACGGGERPARAHQPALSGGDRAELFRRARLEKTSVHASAFTISRDQITTLRRNAIFKGITTQYLRRLPE